MSHRLVIGVAALALALTSCSSDSSSSSPSPSSSPSTGVAGGDVDRVPGAVVDGDSIAVSPDGSTIAAGCGDDLCLWSTGDGSLTATYEGGDVVAWSPDGTLLATSGFLQDRAAVVLLAPEDGSEAGRQPAHDVPDAEDAVGVGITDLAFDPKGTLLASAGHDGTVQVWSVPGLTSVAEIATQSDDPAALAFSPDGSQLAVASPDAPVEAFDIPSGEAAGRLGGQQSDIAWADDGPTTDGPARSAYRVALSRTGRLAYTVAGDDTVHVGSEDLVGHTDQPRDVAWSPDGTTLYSASSLDGIIAWDPATGEPVRQFELPQE